jgi:hypothetical protein
LHRHSDERSSSPPGHRPRVHLRSVQATTVVPQDGETLEALAFTYLSVHLCFILHRHLQHRPGRHNLHYSLRG